MRRREFMVFLCGAVTVWPLVAGAQQPNRIRRLGVLMTLAENDAEGQKYIASFTQRLHELGWTDGDNIRIDYRSPGTDVGRIRTAAVELLDLKPDGILAMTPLAIAPLQQMTTTVPIVFVGVTDPLAAGIVASLARPGGNVAGVAALVYSIGGKSLEMLKQVAPAVSRVAVLYNSAQVTQVGLLAAIKTVAPSLGIQVRPLAREMQMRSARSLKPLPIRPVAGWSCCQIRSRLPTAARSSRSRLVTGCPQFTTHKFLHVRVD